MTFKKWGLNTTNIQGDSFLVTGLTLWHLCLRFRWPEHSSQNGFTLGIGKFYRSCVIKLTAIRLSILLLPTQDGPCGGNLVHMGYATNTCYCRSCLTPDTWWGKPAARLTPGLLCPTPPLASDKTSSLAMSFFLTSVPKTSSHICHFAPVTAAKISFMPFRPTVYISLTATL